MYTLTFSFTHNNTNARLLGLEPTLIRAVLTIPRERSDGITYPFVQWVAEIKRTELSADIKRLKRLCLRDNPGIKVDVCVPTEWIQTA